MQGTFGSSPTNSWRKQQKLEIPSPPAQLRMHTPTYFSEEYSAQKHTFSQPQWMPSAPEPQHPLQCQEIQEEELHRALKRARSGSSPSPIDQVPYRVLKECPAVITPLLHIFNLCWSSGKVPQQWKQAVIRLIPKNSAKDRPNDLSQFRPIALTSCVGKLYTSILKERLMQFMTSNNYINTATQKAFIKDVPGCTEHQFKLWQAILDARRNQRNITVCWLDLANAFGSIHHNLITHALWHYHLPAHFIRIIIIHRPDSCNLHKTMGDTASSPGKRSFPG